jgi:hypothetical protein
MLWQTAISVLVRPETVVNAQKQPLIQSIRGMGEINQTGVLQFVTIWSLRPGLGIGQGNSRVKRPSAAATVA